MTRHDTGFPGRPKTSVPLGARPNHSGLPGLWATRQKISSTPSAASAGFTWSCGPTLTPPVETTTSADSIASASIRSVAPRSSGTTPCTVTSTPARAASAVIEARFDS